MNEIMEKWLTEHPDATLREAFTEGWLSCTDAWCRGKREQFEQLIEDLKQIIV